MDEIRAAKSAGCPCRRAAGLTSAPEKNTSLPIGLWPRTIGYLTTFAEGPWPTQVDPSAEISPGCQIIGGSYVGARCLVEDDVLLEDSILFPDSFVPRGTTLRSCVVAGVRIAARRFSGDRFRMSIERLVDQTRERFPHYQESKVEILPLEKGGSDRHYYRVRFSADHSLILVKYNPGKPENERFVAIANFLNGIGVNAPLIYHHDQDQALIWMQDLGEEDLWHHRNEPWSTRCRFYEAALDQIAILHRSEPVLGEKLHLQPGFDESLYRWEQNYGLENCFGLYFQIPATKIDNLRDSSRVRKSRQTFRFSPADFGPP